MRLILAVISAALAAAGYPLGAAPSSPQAKARVLSRGDLADKIRGGWAGQMIGVSYGAPTEFKSNARILEGELKWAPGMVDNSINQDDLYVEMTFVKVLEKHGLGAGSAQFGEAFKNSQYSLWHANAAARRALNQGIKPPWSGHPKYNLHANDIDFQIEADFIGLMCPGLPRVANDYAQRVGCVMNYGDGIYGGMFVGGMYAAAYFEKDPRRVVEAGLACIPAQSSYGLLIRDLLDWSAQHPNDWRKVWQLVQDKWDKDDPCSDGALSAFNIDAKLNGAYLAFGLLFGRGDFLKTMEISTRCGQDSDCNPSSAAGVLGVMLGFSQIPDEYKSGLAKIADTKFAYTDYSFNDICRVTEELALKIIRQNGGRTSEQQVEVPWQAPKPPKLEQWSPGIPDRRIGVKEADWSWQGAWIEEKGAKISEQAGALATLRFNGVAVALVGRLSQEGGLADIILDGKKIGVADAFIPPRTHDNALWHTYGLRPGLHILSVIVRGEGNDRSKGRKIILERAIVYRAK